MGKLKIKKKKCALFIVLSCNLAVFITQVHCTCIFIHHAVESTLSQNAQYPANTEQSGMQTENEELPVNVDGTEVRTVSTIDKSCKVRFIKNIT